MIKHTILKNYFGYDDFRPGQEEIINCLLSGKDAIGILPTGSGKSICYQIPAMCMPGITIVVSPLISLMKDQVQTLVQNGIPAAYINSTLTYEQISKVIENACNLKYKIIYVAPERLDSNLFVKFAKSTMISMLTVDEAHCISQWGQDFRPSYLKICDFLDQLSYRPVISAFTATATKEVRSDITKILKLNDPIITMTGFDRPNLYFEVRRPAKKYPELISYIRSNKNKSGIIYCATRKTVEQVCDKLIKDGIKATRYHAGLGDDERAKNQDDFLYDRALIIVATNAFGMGIDKSNVGFVIHYNMPKDIESYYQEAGRAGRDGAEADCILLYSPGDIRTNQMLIDAENEAAAKLTPHTRAFLKEKAISRLKSMTFYCHTSQCLRQCILRYFGEKSSAQCHNCSNCTSDYNTIDVLGDCKIIAQCISTAGRCYGRTMICSILQGKDNQRIRNAGLNMISSYGSLKKLSFDDISKRITFMIENRYLSISQDKYSVLSAGERFLELESITALLMKDAIRNNLDKNQDIDEGLFEILKKERLKIAKKLGVPAFVVFSDATLADMCRKMPKNEQEFLEVSGVGNVKLKKFGKDFLKAINDYK